MTIFLIVNITFTIHITYGHDQDHSHATDPQNDFYYNHDPYLDHEHIHDPDDPGHLLPDEVDPGVPDLLLIELEPRFRSLLTEYKAWIN